MIIEHVNGEARQVFMLGEHRYYSPVKIGAGYRKRIDLAKAASVINSETWTATIAMFSGRKKPNGMPEDAWQQQIKDEAVKVVMEGLDVKDSADGELAVLEVLLTPAEGSPSVKKAYDEDATDEQVAAIVNFSEGLVVPKTETAPLQTTSGKATKAKRVEA